MTSGNSRHNSGVLMKHSERITEILARLEVALEAIQPEPFWSDIEYLLKVDAMLTSKFVELSILEDSGGCAEEIGAEARCLLDALDKLAGEK